MSDVIRRIYLVNPNEGGRFYLRLLLLNVKGATSFEDLRAPHDTFLESCLFIYSNSIKASSENDHALHMQK